jgi:hypothetical protein
VRTSDEKPASATDELREHETVGSLLAYDLRRMGHLYRKMAPFAVPVLLVAVIVLATLLARSPSGTEAYVYRATYRYDTLHRSGPWGRQDLLVRTDQKTGQSEWLSGKGWKPMGATK